MNIPDSAITINSEQIQGKVMYFASTKFAGQRYIANGDTEREAKYNLVREVEAAQSRPKPRRE